MQASGGMKAGFALVLTTSLAACRTIAFSSTTPTSASIPTQQVRRDHEELAARLDEAERTIAALAASHDTNEQITLMHELVVLFSVHVEEQADWEERVLFPQVEQRAGGAAITAPFRTDHATIERWLRELVAMHDADPPDPAAFVLRSYQLLDLVRGHVEREDRALLPLLPQQP